ncbi:phage baseplate assembly protein V [Caulobacter soli]|uniref:phage baseplate assembly protein V n=1 Tax=Caulobacter soli TaxID=2708539 RepID=UPI0013EDDE66|nr:phage baseplate assembly protein V [Caulobacter soli]
MMNQFRKALAPTARAVGMMVARVLVRLVDDSPGVQQLQVDGLADETLDGIERFQNYGFTSRPKPGAEGIMVAVAGTRSQGVVIVVDDRRYRLRELAEGEVAMQDDLGQVVHFKRDGISIESPFKVEITAPSVKVTADHVVVDSADVQLGGAGGKAVALHGDSVVANKVVSSSTKVKAA